MKCIYPFGEFLHFFRLTILLPSGQQKFTYVLHKLQLLEFNTIIFGCFCEQVSNYFFPFCSKSNYKSKQVNMPWFSLTRNGMEWNLIPSRSYFVFPFETDRRNWITNYVRWLNYPLLIFFSDFCRVQNMKYIYNSCLVCKKSNDTTIC